MLGEPFLAFFTVALFLTAMVATLSEVISVHLTLHLTLGRVLLLSESSGVWILQVL